jgi:[ribosomal protein S5]-alanine N-acetyltransferase
MQSNRLKIRYFNENDLEYLYRLLSDKEVMRFLEPPYTKEKTARFLSDAGLCDKPLIYAVDDQDGKFIGYVIYHVYEENSYEIGWVLYQEEWHKGYTQELTQMLIRDAKEKSRDLVIECLPEQEISRHVALSNGFEYYGNVDECDVYLLKIN